MQNLNSWLSRIWTFPEKWRTCEKIALWAQALTLHLESEGATGAGWGGYWDDTEARKKIPNVIIQWPFDFNGFHSLSLLLASTPEAEGAVNGKAITEPWLVGSTHFPGRSHFLWQKLGAGKLPLEERWKHLPWKGPLEYPGQATVMSPKGTDRRCHQKDRENGGQCLSSETIFVIAENDASHG